MERGGVLSPDDAPIIRTDVGNAFSNIADGLGLTWLGNQIFRGGKSKEQKQLEYLEGIAIQAGEDVGAGIATGIGTSTAEAVASAQALADQVSAALNSIAVPNVGAMMQAAMASGNMLAAASGGISVMLNKRKVGQMITPTVSTQQARSARR